MYFNTNFLKIMFLWSNYYIIKIRAATKKKLRNKQDDNNIKLNCFNYKKNTI